MCIQLKCLDIKLEEVSWDNFEWQRKRFPRPFPLLYCLCHVTKIINKNKRRFFLRKYDYKGIAGSKRVQCAPGPISFIFMQFSSKTLPNNRFLLQNQMLTPPFHLGNPGSATGKSILYKNERIVSSFWKQQWFHLLLAETSKIIFFLSNNCSNLKRTICILNEVVAVFKPFLCRTKKPINVTHCVRLLSVSMTIIESDSPGLCNVIDVFISLLCCCEIMFDNLHVAFMMVANIVAFIDFVIVRSVYNWLRISWTNTQSCNIYLCILFL